MAKNLLTPNLHIAGNPNHRHNLLRPMYMKAGSQIKLNPAMVDEDEVKSPLDLKTQKRFMPRVAILFGRRGQGKTLWLTNMLYLMKKRYEASGHKFKVFTNYKASFADYSTPYLLDEISEFPTWANNAIIGLDEIADLLPSARAMSNHSLLSQTFFRQIRKRGCEVLCATQFPQEITRALLRQVDWFIETEIQQGGRGVRTYWHDWWGQFTGVFKLRYWPPERAAHDYSFTLWGTDAMFGQYETEEVVASVYSDSREDIIKQQWDLAGDGHGSPLDEIAIPASEFAADPTLTMMLEWIDRGAVLGLDDLIPLAKDELDQDYMSDSKLTNILRRRGYMVERDEEGDLVVFKPQQGELE